MTILIGFALLVLAVVALAMLFSEVDL